MRKFRQVDYAGEWLQHERRIKREWIAETLAFVVCYALAVGFAFAMYFFC